MTRESRIPHVIPNNPVHVPYTCIHTNTHCHLARAPLTITLHYIIKTNYKGKCADYKRKLADDKGYWTAIMKKIRRCIAPASHRRTFQELQREVKSRVNLESLLIKNNEHLYYNTCIVRICFMYVYKKCLCYVMSVNVMLYIIKIMYWIYII